MAGSVDLNSLTISVVQNAVPTTLPDIRLKGTVEREQGEGVPNLIIIDFTSGPLADADKNGTSLWALLASRSTDQAAVQAICNAFDIDALALAFAGVS